MSSKEMVKYAQVTNRIELLEEIKYEYSQKEKGTKIAMIIFFIIAVFMCGSALTIDSGEEGKKIIIAGIVFFGFIFFIMISTMLGAKKRLNEIIKNNEPMLCYIGDVVRLYKVSGGENKRDKHYIELTNDIKLKISRALYRELKDKDVKRVNVYFYEKTLEDNVFIVKDYNEEMNNENY